jgi:circadian clock protein KaiC
MIKARGMSHSNQVREFQMSAAGIRLVDAYVGPAGVLTGTARMVQEAEEQAGLLRQRQEAERRKREVVRRRLSIERQIAELRASLEVAEEEEIVLREEDDTRETQLGLERRAIAARRSAAE